VLKVGVVESEANNLQKVLDKSRRIRCHLHEPEHEDIDIITPWHSPRLVVKTAHLLLFHCVIDNIAGIRDGASEGLGSGR
jgi:hypothetical protein